MKIERSTMQLVVKNLDKEYKKDKKNNKCFTIKDTEPFDKNKKKNKHGIYSPLYGTDDHDDNGYSDRYSCECRAIQGKVFKGTRCDKCNTLVKYRSVELSMFGYIKLKRNYLISPIMYRYLIKLIGKKYIFDIVKFPSEIDSDGNIVYPDKPKDNPFYNIGMIEFYERFDEIIDHFNTKQKQKTYNFIVKNRNKVFMQAIPVYTAILRPILIKSEDGNMFLSKINTSYRGLVRKVLDVNRLSKKKLTEERVKSINGKLYNAQYLINKIYLEIIENEIIDKNGIIRGAIMGGRLNYTARNVVKPFVNNKRLDEIELPYLTFLELYNEEIANTLSKMDNISIYSAYERVFFAHLEFDNRIYEIMEYLVNTTVGGVKVIINRNPTLTFGSMWCVRVCHVKNDYNDYTMSIPIDILVPMNCDFDGDVLNILALKDNRMKRFFNKFNPRHNMISHDDGLLDPRMLLVKDQMISLYLLANV